MKQKTRDMINQIAQQSGFVMYDGIITGRVADADISDMLYCFAKLVQLREQERYAKMVDMVAREIDDTNGLATYIAKMIRASDQ